ncbi:MAG: DUF455 family protein, partial [Proteobacteria bacterium]|nr:DUF455 family protein [Pseudomonadota bacterium]
PKSVREFCRRILESGDLETKLAPPGPLDDHEPGPALSIDRPARAPGLRLAGGSAPLPRPSELGHADARARALARFAHHELMAVELFAWALLRWPELPRALRDDLLAVLADEQRHCQLYRSRLREHGSRLADHAPHSDYFWRHAPAVAASPAGPRAFLAAMGLTLEQANLDFSLVYRDAFRAAGDEESARVCERVHRDEIGHVGVASRWLQSLSPERDLVAAYDEAVPFPLSAARAKGHRFDASARRKAGLDERFIGYIRDARSSQETGQSQSGGRPQR